MKLIRHITYLFVLTSLPVFAQIKDVEFIFECPNNFNGRVRIINCELEELRAPLFPIGPDGCRGQAQLSAWQVSAAGEAGMTHDSDVYGATVYSISRLGYDTGIMHYTEARSYSFRIIRFAVGPDPVNINYRLIANMVTTGLFPLFDNYAKAYFYRLDVPELIDFVYAVPESPQQTRQGDRTLEPGRYEFVFEVESGAYHGSYLVCGMKSKWPLEYHAIAEAQHTLRIIP